MARAGSRRASLVSLTGEDLSEELLEVKEALDDLFPSSAARYHVLHVDSLSVVLHKPAADGKKPVLIKLVRKSFLKDEHFVNLGVSSGRGFVLRDLLRYEQGEQSLPKLVGYMEQQKFHVIITNTYGLTKPKIILTREEKEACRKGNCPRFDIDMVNNWRVAVGRSSV